MKKSTILSLLTTGMIVTTSVATYALWDTVAATSTAATVTMRNPVTITDNTDQGPIDVDANTLNPLAPTASGTVKFNVANEDNVATSLELQEEITAQSKLEESTDYTIEFTGDGVSGKTDSSVTQGQETYNYTITFTERGLSKLSSNSNQCTVQVTATLK